MVKIYHLNNYDVVADCGYDYKALKYVKSALKVKLPRGQYNPHFGYRKDGIERLYTHSTDITAQIRFKRGHLDRLKKYLTEKRIPFEVLSPQLLPRDIGEVQFSHWVQADERDYQRHAAEAFLRHRFGIIQVPTRGGKTVIASEIIRCMTVENPNLKVLFLTDLTDLWSQTVAELEKFLVEPVGEVKGEYFHPERVTVAMTQTVQSKIKREKPLKQRHRKFHQWLSEIDFVIVDECHDFSSPSRIDILKLTKSWDILGLSGTPEKSTDFISNLRMKGIMGDVVYKIHEKDLEDRNVLAKSRVLLCTFETYTGLFDVEYQQFIKRFVYNNKERNDFIATMVMICIELGLKVLVMTRSTEHGEILAQYGFEYISGKDDAYERKRVKKLITEEPGGVGVIVTEIWKKGITLPQAQVLINITVGKEHSNVLQKRGRILGAVEGKSKALAIDVIDFCDLYLSDHAYERINAYEYQTGLNNIDVLHNNPEDTFPQRFYDYVNDWFYGK